MSNFSNQLAEINFRHQQVMEEIQRQQQQFEEQMIINQTAIEAAMAEHNNAQVQFILEQQLQQFDMMSQQILGLL